jgi:hypothetical protein
MGECESPDRKGWRARVAVLRRVKLLGIIVTQIALAILLFYAVNWIGEHSSTFGYLQLSLLSKRDPAPAFNFLLKTLAPTIYIILVATALYLLKRDRFVHHIWLVCAYYFAFRVFYNVLLSRAPLLDWISVAIQTATGIGAAYLAYIRLILPRHPLFPGVESIGNQLWIIIALFLYAVVNNVQVSTKRSVRRKNKYLRLQFAKYKEMYGGLINGQFPERYMELVTYAVLIYEGFNRPWLAQKVERIVFPWGSRSLGPMQVRTPTRLSDRESVVIGVQRLRDAFELTNQEVGTKPTPRYQILYMTLGKYNRDQTYISETCEVLHVLWAQVATDYRSEFENMYAPVTAVVASRPT